MLHLVDTDSAAIMTHLVHHVECQYHRHAKLHQLHGEVEVTFYIVGIDNIDNRLGFFFKYELTRHYLLVGVRRERINSWEVGDKGLGFTFYHAVFAVDSNTWEVSYVLV